MADRRVKGYLNDQSGNKSSKRLAGMLLIVGAILQSFSLTIYVMAGYTADHKTFSLLVDLTVWLAMTGAAVLGVGVAEFFKRS